MHFKTLLLLTGLAGISMARADNDPYLWLEGIDDGTDRTLAQDSLIRAI